MVDVATSGQGAPSEPPDGSSPGAGSGAGGGVPAPSSETSTEPAAEGTLGDSIEAAVRRFFAPRDASPEEVRWLARIADSWRTTLRRLRPLGEVSEGNAVAVLAEGDLAFGHMWAGIRAARERIVMETYTLENDRVGRRTVRLLTMAAERGVDVLLVYDAVGSDIGASFTEALTEAGGRVFAFNPVWSVRRRLSRLVRNHRKILVVDGEHAFCGGMNQGEAYAGTRYGSGLFRDTHLELHGLAARDLEALVRATVEDQGGRLRRAPLVEELEPERPFDRIKTGTDALAQRGLDAVHSDAVHSDEQRPDEEELGVQLPEGPYEVEDTAVGPALAGTAGARFEERAAEHGAFFATRTPDVLVQILESNVARQRRAIQKALRLTLDRAVDHCYLTSPYFVPPRRLLRAIERAAKRGVDVRVLTAGRSDVPVVRIASRHLYARLLKKGVRIFELQPKALHAKIVTADGIYASVGSFNLDAWSWRRNLEVTVAMLDRRVTATLESQFEEDLAQSVEICEVDWERRGLWSRCVSWLAYSVLRF